VTTADFLLCRQLLNDYQEMRRLRFFERYSASPCRPKVDLLLQYLTRLARVEQAVALTGEK
jgi:hypothetical protein